MSYQRKKKFGAADEPYPVEILSLLVFGYGFILKFIVIFTVVLFDCEQFRRFWEESEVMSYFASMLALLAILAALPIFGKLFGGSVSKSEFGWATVTTGFALYVASWLVIVYAYLHRDTVIGGYLSELFSFFADHPKC